MYKLFSNIIGHINQKIAVIGILLGVSIAFINVVARYVFDSSLAWASELTIILFLLSMFFASAYCFKKDAHISVTIILDILPLRIAKIILIITHIITLVFLLYIAYYGYEYSKLMYEFEEINQDLWDIPTFYLYMIIPISFLLGAFRVAQRIHIILSTNHKNILKESEAEQLLERIGENKNFNENNNIQKLNKLVKDVEKKSGGML